MSKIRRTADIINIIMMSLCISVVIMGMIDVMVDLDLKRYPMLFTGVFVIMMFGYLFRTLTRRIILYLLFHTMLCAAFFMLIFREKSDFYSGIPIMWFVLSIILFIVDIAFWTGAVNEERNLPVQENGEPIERFRPVYREGFADISVYFACVFILITLLGIYKHFDRLGRYAYTAGIIFVILSLIRLYIRNVSALVETTELGNNVTQKRLLKANTRLVIPFFLLIIIAMTIFQSEVTADMINRFLGILLKALAYIIAFIMMLFSVFGEGETDEPMKMNPLNLEYGDSPAWVDMILKGFEYLLAAALVAAIVYLIVKLVINLVKNYSARSINKLKQHQYGDMTEISERIESTVKKSKRERRGLFSHMENREKVRYLYRKRVEGTGFVVQNSHTPNERLQDITNKTMNGTMSKTTNKTANKSIDRTTIKAVTRLVNITPTYNKARYSADEIGDEEVNAVK